MRPILLILGKSGSGKTTICNELEKKYGLKAIPSYTTRHPRYNGEKGHTFISEQEFDELKDIIAFAKTDKCRYAVTKDMFEDEQYSVYVIDMTGLKYLLRNYHGDRKIISIYIDVDVETRFQRMVDRDDLRSYDDKVYAALRRIEHDAIEFNDSDIDEYVGYRVANWDEQLGRTVAYIKIICENYMIL